MCLAHREGSWICGGGREAGGYKLQRIHIAESSISGEISLHVEPPAEISAGISSNTK